jgi:hypothetical protein
MSRRFGHDLGDPLLTIVQVLLDPPHWSRVPSLHLLRREHRDQPPQPVILIAPHPAAKKLRMHQTTRGIDAGSTQLPHANQPLQGIVLVRVGSITGKIAAGPMRFLLPRTNIMVLP